MEAHDVEEIVRLLGRVLDLEEILKARVDQMDRRIEQNEEAQIQEPVGDLERRVRHIEQVLRLNRALLG